MTNRLLENMKNKVESLNVSIDMLMTMINGGTVSVNNPFNGGTDEYAIDQENRDKALYKTLPKLEKECNNLIVRIRYQDPQY